MSSSIRKIAFAAVIAAVYAAMTILLSFMSYGPIQFRVAEVLCILPFFFPVSVWGLFVGCILSNLLSAYGIIDIVFGSLATLLAALCTMQLGKICRERVSIKALACLPPVIFNGLIVGAVIAFSTTPDAFWAGFAINGLQVAFGELVVMAVLGLPLMIWLPKTHFFKELQYHLMNTQKINGGTL
jgi:uncharacterized membrane protein